MKKVSITLHTAKKLKEIAYNNRELLDKNKHHYEELMSHATSVATVMHRGCGKNIDMDTLTEYCIEYAFKKNWITDLGHVALKKEIERSKDHVTYKQWVLRQLIRTDVY